MLKHGIRFYLKTPQSVSSSLYARITFASSYVKVYLNLLIECRYWDGDKQKAVSTVSGRRYPIAGDINGFLERFRTEVSNIFAAAAMRGKAVEPPELQKHLNNFISPQRMAQKTDILILFSKFIAGQKSKVSEARVKIYNNTLRHLREFADSENIPLNLNSITEDFYNKFIAYLFNKQFAPSHVRNLVKVLRLFLKDVCKQELADIPVQKFGLPKNILPDIVSLTEDELNAIAQVDLSFAPHLDHCRGLFLIQCYTGLRFSDASRLTPSHISKEEKRIQITTQKTKQALVIPIVDELRKHLSTYDLKPAEFTNQEMNRYLKMIASHAGINTPVRRVEHKGHERIETIVPKWRLVTTHTGRRTFITLALTNGSIAQAIMKVSGHTDYASFRRYVEITDTFAEQNISEAFGKIQKRQKTRSLKPVQPKQKIRS